MKKRFLNLYLTNNTPSTILRSPAKHGSDAGGSFSPSAFCAIQAGDFWVGWANRGSGHNFSPTSIPYTCYLRSTCKASGSDGGGYPSQLAFCGTYQGSPGVSWAYQYADRYGFSPTKK